MKNCKFDFFTSKEIKPQGWLKKQLRIQADGLSGNLDKVWPDVSRSKWIGLEKDGWERVPYWLDGFIPLAYLLDDDDLKKRAQKYIDSIIKGQKEDGWICPCEDSERSEYDVWAAILISKVLTVYEDCSGDEKVSDVIYNVLRNFFEHIKEHPLFRWAQYRWYEMLIPIYRIYKKTNEAWLIDLAHLLKEQGKDFDEIFSSDEIKSYFDHWTWDHHVVNIAMALKSEALYSLFGEVESERLADKMLSMLDKYHSTAYGHFTGDECLSGDSPLHGTELCGIVEAMYSYEWLFAVTGNTYWLTRLENLAYNALPAQNSVDMWTHQYVQQTNQISCIRMWGDSYFNSNNGEAHIFGLEPHFGCCTANFNQGFPKFALSAFYKADDGIVVTNLAPASLDTEINGVKVNINLKTDYPFGNSFEYTVKADSPVRFSLYVRIPSFADNDGKGFIIYNEEWDKEKKIKLEYDFPIRFEERPRNMTVLKYGPLLFALPIEERRVMHEYTKKGVERKFPYCDYELYPVSKWNYAFCDNDTNKVKIVKNDIPDYPFSKEKSAFELYADMCEIDWGNEKGYPDFCSMEPKSRKAISDLKKMRLIPYGCTDLRITETVFAEKE